MPLFDLFPLPPGLDPVFLAWLESHVAALAPRDGYETLLVGRIAQALARLHRSALNEPAGLPGNLWLRYEAAADRLYRQSLSALQKYRKENPVELVDTQAPDASISPPLPPGEGPGRGSDEPTTPTPAPSRRRAPASVWPTYVHGDGAAHEPAIPHPAAHGNTNGNGNGNGHAHHPDAP